MIHLHVRSWFSFLAGASSPERLAARAAQLGQPALALTDLHGVYGAVRFARACKKVGVRPIVGATLMVEEHPLVLLAQDREGYANLSRLVGLAHRRGSQDPKLSQEELREAATERLLALTGGYRSRLDQLLLQRQGALAREWLSRLEEKFPDALYVELAPTGRPGDRRRLEALLGLAERAGVPCLLSNAVRYAGPEDFPRYDALTCVRLGVTVGQPHAQRPVNDQAYLCDASVIFEKLGGDLKPYMRACEHTQLAAQRCDLELLPESVTPPSAELPPGKDPRRYLRELCAQGMERRYREEQRSKAQAQLERELSVVEDLDLSEFFLVVREVTDFSWSRGIRCAGRGSAANSIIAYLLGITTVDPLEHRLLFERFLHRGRKGMPDIDVDFDSERRPEVIAWMEERFGAEHCAMTATVQTYQTRGAMREMMKVLGWDAITVDKIGSLVGHWEALESVRARRPEWEAILGKTPLLDVLFQLLEGLRHCPRHLSLHNGGMVLTRKPLPYYSPIQTSTGGYRQVQFDKDDVEALGLIKFDILGLRMLAVLSEAVALEREDSGRTLDLETIPFDDEPTFELIRSGETMSLFQIESPGQMSLLARTQPKNFRDLVVQVALFRPGPLQGGMVNPFLYRKAGLEVPDRPGTIDPYDHPVLREILEDTHGIIIFQEQVLEICHLFAGLSLDEADEFRRLMSKWRDPGDMQAMGERFMESAIALHGVSQELAAEVFRQVAAFVGYGFCRSHAAAFARTVFQSAYLKRHHPAPYMAAVLQHKPGFFPMSTVLEEARRMGVEFLPVCLLRSSVKYRLEGGSIRLPFTQVAEIREETAFKLMAWQRGPGRAFASGERAMEGLWAELLAVVDLSVEQWESLARAGAFDRIAPRREALWRVGVNSESGQPRGPIRVQPAPRKTSDFGRSGGTGRRATRREKPREPEPEPQRTLDLRFAGERAQLPRLRPLPPGLSLSWDFATQGLSTQEHPLARHRRRLQKSGAVPIGSLTRLPVGGTVAVGGWVIVRQRPPTAKGMTFVLMEDESGRVQVAVPPQVYESYQRVVLYSGALWVRGKLEGPQPLGNAPQGVHRSIMLREASDLEEVLGVKLFVPDAVGKDPNAG